MIKQMKTVLVPIDFSDTSANAVDYTAGFCKQFDYQRVILLKSFYDTLFDEVVMSAAYGGVDTSFRAREHEEAEATLKEWGRKLSQKNREVVVEAITTELPIMRAIAQAVRDENPRSILFGSDNNAYDNDSYVSGHAIEIAKSSPVNVMIVPAGQSYQPIEEVLIPVDSFSRGSLARLDELSNRPYLGKMKLDVLKLDAGSTNGNGQGAGKEDEELHRVLSDVRHEIFTGNEKKAIDAIMNFLKGHSVQLILALPGKYSFLYRLTHQLIGEAICRNTEKPVLIVKEFV
jgi:nucleotide-binding universal stress UspA family protein